MSSEEGVRFCPRRPPSSGSEGAVSVVEWAVAVVEESRLDEGANTLSCETWVTTGRVPSSMAWLLQGRTWALWSKEACERGASHVLVAAGGGADDAEGSGMVIMAESAWRGER